MSQCKAGSGSWGKEKLVFLFHRMRCEEISPRLQIMSVVDLRMEDLGVPSWHLGHGLDCCVGECVPPPPRTGRSWAETTGTHRSASSSALIRCCTSLLLPGALQGQTRISGVEMTLCLLNGTECKWFPQNSSEFLW